jgi:cell wall assembly regulator SMI1
LEIKLILEKLSKFESPDFELFDSCPSTKIIELEKKLGYPFPNDFKEFLQITNGAIIDASYIYGIYDDNKAFDLFERYIWEKDSAENPIKKNYLPFYPDGFGNHNCLDLASYDSTSGKCNVIFWQHDWFYEDGELPEVDAESFTEFLEKLLHELN